MLYQYQTVISSNLSTSQDQELSPIYSCTFGTPHSVFHTVDPQSVMLT